MGYEKRLRKEKLKKERSNLVTFLKKFAFQLLLLLLLSYFIILEELKQDHNIIY